MTGSIRNSRRPDQILYDILMRQDFTALNEYHNHGAYLLINKTRRTINPCGCYRVSGSIFFRFCEAIQKDLGFSVNAPLIEMVGERPRSNLISKMGKH